MNDPSTNSAAHKWGPNHIGVSSLVQWVSEREALLQAVALGDDGVVTSGVVLSRLSDGRLQVRLCEEVGGVAARWTSAMHFSGDAQDKAVAVFECWKSMRMARGAEVTWTLTHDEMTTGVRRKDAIPGAVTSRRRANDGPAGYAAVSRGFTPPRTLAVA